VSSSPITPISCSVYTNMNLLSILNNDDSRKSSPSVAPSVNNHLPTNPSLPLAEIPPQDGRSGNEANNDGTLPRKRQRVEDPPSPSSVALPIASKPPPLNSLPAGQNTTGGITGPGVSPQQTSKPLPASQTQASGPRTNSMSIANDPIDVLEPSIVNMQPSEELTRFISDFIFLNLNETQYENIEVYASSSVLILD
jgi:hypothetical protein